MKIAARILYRVVMHPRPSYILCLVNPDDVTRSSTVIIPLKAPVRTKADAQHAAMSEMFDLSDVELRLLSMAQNRPIN